MDAFLPGFLFYCIVSVIYFELNPVVITKAKLQVFVICKFRLGKSCRFGPRDSLHICTAENTVFYLMFQICCDLSI